MTDEQLIRTLKIAAETQENIALQILLFIAAERIEKQPILEIDEIVNRFLCWKLPEHFSPDCGISFKQYSDYEHPVFGRNKYEPVGTNLFSADQAKAMFEYVLETKTS